MSTVASRPTLSADVTDAFRAELVDQTNAVMATIGTAVHFEPAISDHTREHLVLALAHCERMLLELEEAFR